ncbi:50S ribosomal protein L10 [candidate division WOR-3 bacterium]|nr:50S ribosomal protein L10 [candidate division WOR-3 bacterium]
MPTQEKMNQVEELMQKMKDAKAIYISDYKGMTVAQMTSFRKKVRDAGLHFKVVKNTMTKLALEKNGFSGMEEILTGPTAIAIGYQDPVLPAKIIKENFSQVGFPIIKGGFLEGKSVSKEEIEKIADLPPKEVLLGQLTGTFAAPISSFMAVGNNILSGFLRVMTAIKESKENNKTE